MGGQVADAPRDQIFWLHPIEQIVIIGVDTRHKEGDHRLWDRRNDNPLDEGMIENVAANGVKVPTKVKKITRKMVEADPLFDEKHIGMFLMAWGRTRTRWARAAMKLPSRRGKPPIRVPAIVSDADISELAKESKVENAVRVQVDPIQEALDIKLLKEQGYSIDEIRVSYGLKTDAQVHAKLRVLKLSERVQDALRAKKISTSAAMRLAKYDEAEQDRRLARVLEAVGPARATEESVRKSTTAADSLKGLSKPLMRKLADVKTLHPLLRRFMRVASGEKEARTCPGLAKALREIGYEA